MKYLAAIAAAMLLVACSKKTENKRLDKIEKSITDNALGADLGYEQGKLDTLIILKASTAISDLEKELGAPVSTDWKKADRIYGAVVDSARSVNDINTFHFWKWEVERMQYLRNLKPGDTDLSIYKYTYKINNLLNPKGDKRTVVNYYIFNYLDSLAGHIDDERLKALKRDYIQSDTQPYEIALMQAETGLKD